MKRFMLLVALAVILLAAAAHAARVNNVNWTSTSTFVSTDDDVWNVSLSYQSSETSLNGSWMMPSETDAAVILCFREGGASIVVCGTEPCELRDRSWPCWNNGSRRDRPEFSAILTTRVEPVDDDRITVSGTIDRMVLVDSGRRDQFAFEKESFSRTVRINDVWELSLGEDNNGKARTVELRVDGQGGSTSRDRARSSELMHVRIRHEVEDLRAPRGDRTKVSRGAFEIGPDNEDETSVALKTALTPHRGDSTVLFTKISFKDTRIREQPRGGLRLTATFVMDRRLAVGDIREAESGKTWISGDMIVSTFEKRITLRLGQPLRIRIPMQDGEDQFIDTDEVLELELDGPADGSY